MAPSTPSSGSTNGVLHAINPADPAGNASANAPAASPAANSNVSPGNTVQLHQLVTGCKVMVDRSMHDEDPRKAEILSIRAGKVARGRPKEGQEPERPQMQYYIHYVEFNKRLDEWVPANRLLMSMPVEWPSTSSSASSHHGSPAPVSKAPQVQRADSQNLRRTAIKTAASKADQQGQKAPSKAPSKTKNTKKRKTAQSSRAQSPATAPATPSAKSTAGDDDDSIMNIDSPSTRSVSLNPDRESSTDPATPKEGTPDIDGDGEGEDEDADGEADQSGAVVSVEMMDDNVDGEDDADPAEAAAPNVLEDHSHFSKEQEIESLRTHGSMTQSVHEVSRVKNLDRIQIGAAEVEAWYFSPYPVEYAHIPVLYICEFCLCFYGSPKMLERHRRKCTLLHPPGNEIYRHEEISFYEIDGKKQKTWCRNLCLLSKCFLDHKTLYYDVDPFMFYCMAKRDDMGVHLIGYFSKEKESAENYNVACILTLPQHQRHGYGKLLIEFSYELSKVEKKLGSPEKPLSDLGLLSYRAYWQEIIVDFILDRKGSGHDEVSIDEIAQKTCILHNDIMHTAQTLQMLKFYKNQYVLCLSDALIEQHERSKKKKRRRINPQALIWKPPHFSKDQLRFGF